MEQELETLFFKIKKGVARTPVLRYKIRDVTLQCDHSEFSLGVAILQHRQPICYTSQTLTEKMTYLFEVCSSRKRILRNLVFINTSLEEKLLSLKLITKN